MLGPDEINAIIARTTQRPTYIEQVLTFTLGRPPTQGEIDAVNDDFRLRRVVHEKWVAAQPWHTRKRYIDRQDRIERVITKRYDVPEWLINAYKSEIEGGDDAAA